MGEPEKSEVRFWGTVIVPWALFVYLVSMIAGQALIQRALLPRWLARFVEIAYVPLGWLIGLID